MNKIGMYKWYQLNFGQNQLHVALILGANNFILLTAFLEQMFWLSYPLSFFKWQQWGSSQ